MQVVNNAFLRTTFVNVLHGFTTWFWTESALARQKQTIEGSIIMKQAFTLTLALLSISVGFSTNFYSIADGNWNDALNWSLSPEGPATTTAPNAQDTVFIDHLILHNTGNSYTHYGNVIVLEDGEYRINTGIGSNMVYYFAGERFEIFGHLWTSSDFHHQIQGTSGNGLMAFQEGSQVEIGDDLILNAYGRAILNTFDCGNASVADDIYFVGTNAQMCGEGHFIVPDMLRAWNDSNHEVFPAASQITNQLCNGFGLYSSVPNCQSGSPEVTGGGPFDLPVEFLRFEAQWVGNTVQLDWQTASEVNNAYFTVERAVDSLHFKVLDQVAGAGTSMQINTYQSIDAFPLSATAYYRIKQTDLDGSFSYSSVIELTYQNLRPSLSIYPNPASGSHLTLQGLPSHQPLLVRFTNLNGQTLQQTQHQATVFSEIRVSIPQDLTPGCYLISVMSESFLLTETIWLQ